MGEDETSVVVGEEREVVDMVRNAKGVSGVCRVCVKGRQAGEDKDARGPRGCVRDLVAAVCPYLRMWVSFGQRSLAALYCARALCQDHKTIRARGNGAEAAARCDTTERRGFTSRNGA